MDSEITLTCCMFVWCSHAAGGFGQKNKSEKRMSLTRKDVLHFLYPNKVVNEEGGTGSADDEDGRDVDGSSSGGCGDDDSVGALNVDELVGNTTTAADNVAMKEIMDIILLRAMKQLGTEVRNAVVFTRVASLLDP